MKNLFIYNPDSIFDSDTVRWIDYALLAIFLILPIGVSSRYQIPNIHFICIILAAFSAAAITSYALKETTFWIDILSKDEKRFIDWADSSSDDLFRVVTSSVERKVKYAITYATIAFILCSSLFFYIAYTILAFLNGSLHSWGYLLVFIPPIVLILNILFLGSIYYPLLEDNQSFD